MTIIDGIIFTLFKYFYRGLVDLALLNRTSKLSAIYVAEEAI